MNAAAPAVGRAVDAARSSLRAALGDRICSAGSDRAEALAQDGTPLIEDVAVQVLGNIVRVLDVATAAIARFDGFLDGIQRSSTIAYLDGVPLLHGTAAAAIRVRDVSGRMSTWRTPRIEHGIYASRALLGEPVWSTLHDVMEPRGHEIHDSDNGLVVPVRHPSALLRQSLDALSRVRNDMERAVGDAWCHENTDRALYVDGSLRTSQTMLRSPVAVGVVKSHATLYLPGDSFPLVASLGAGQRTSVLAALDAAGRTRFLTWYLRLRSAVGRDPFFGLIRVECGARDGDVGAVETHADEVSSWLLAERAPIAKPDARWDVMPYAIRDCEVYLRAVA